MINKILISICLFLSLISFSQEGSSSPYSFYGIGEAKFQGSVESRSMGGLSIIPDSTRINIQNPAGLANLKWTTFTVAGTTNITKQKSATSEGNAQRTTFDYLSLGLPMGKIGIAFGLMPYSSVGYKVESISSNPAVNSKRFNGKGGLNSVFLGAGYSILPNLSIGASAYYNFGKIQTQWLEFVPSVTSGTNEVNVNDLSGFNFNIGMMYQVKIKEKLTLFSSLYYTPESNLKSENIKTVGVVTFDENYNLNSEETSDPVANNNNLILPQKVSFGLGIGNAEKWVLGAEVSLKDVGKLYNNYNSLANVTYEKSQKFSLGGYYTPNSTYFGSYLERITYRAGLKYEKTGLMVNSSSINDKGLSLGLGFPVTGSLSNVNVGFEIGKKGTLSNNLVEENYFNLSIGISLNDRWFVKRKFR